MLQGKLIREQYTNGYDIISRTEWKDIQKRIRKVVEVLKRGKITINEIEEIRSINSFSKAYPQEAEDRYKNDMFEYYNKYHKEIFAFFKTFLHQIGEIFKKHNEIDII